MALNDISNETLMEFLRRMAGGNSLGAKPATGEIPVPQSRPDPAQVAQEVQDKPKQASGGLLGGLFPSDPAKKEGLSRALMMAGASMLANSGPSFTPQSPLSSLGQGLGVGFQTYDAALDGAKKRQQSEQLAEMQNNLLSDTAVPGSSNNGDFGFSIDKLKQIWEYQVRTGDDAGARDTLGMIQKLQQEAASQGLVVGSDGRLTGAPGYNSGLQQTEFAKSSGRVAGEESQRQTDDIREYNLYVEQENAAGRTAADFTTWSRANKAAGATNVNVGDGSNSSAFKKKSDEQAAERLSKIVEDGATAPQMIGDMQTLVELGNAIGTGKLAEFQLAVGPYAEVLGINVDGLSEMQAFDAVVSRLAPQMRPAGAGATSDFDAKQYLKSIPSLGRTPEGNQIIADTMSAVAQNKMEAAEIAARAQSEEITWQEADKQIRELPNPYTRFKEYQKGNRNNGSDQPKVDETNNNKEESKNDANGVVVINSEEEFEKLPIGTIVKMGNTSSEEDKLVMR